MKSTVSVRRKIQEITAETPEEELEEAGSLQRKLEFRQVTFGYEEGRQILKDLSLTFEKGKKYALVGNSGSGKSTILRLLLRYYDNYSGEILLDGKEIRTMSESSLRRQCALIPQNVFMFDDTLYNNITLYREYSAERIAEVVRMAGLEVVLQRLNNGLKARIIENGNNLSGGEKQRIAIARALLLGCKIIVMDEATANVDEATAAKIERIILENPELTCISVTHHLLNENMEFYDEVIVVGDGKGKVSKTV